MDLISILLSLRCWWLRLRGKPCPGDKPKEEEPSEPTPTPTPAPTPPDEPQPEPEPPAGDYPTIEEAKARMNFLKDLIKDSGGIAEIHSDYIVWPDPQDYGLRLDRDITIKGSGVIKYHRNYTHSLDFERDANGERGQNSFFNAYNVNFRLEGITLEGPGETYFSMEDNEGVFLDSNTLSIKGHRPAFGSRVKAGEIVLIYTDPDSPPKYDTIASVESFGGEVRITFTGFKGSPGQEVIIATSWYEKGVSLDVIRTGKIFQNKLAPAAVKYYGLEEKAVTIKGCNISNMPTVFESGGVDLDLTIEGNEIGRTYGSGIGYFPKSKDPKPANILNNKIGNTGLAFDYATHQRSNDKKGGHGGYISPNAVLNFIGNVVEESLNLGLRWDSENWPESDTQKKGVVMGNTFNCSQVVLSKLVYSNITSNFFQGLCDLVSGYYTQCEIEKLAPYHRGAPNGYRISATVESCTIKKLLVQASTKEPIVNLVVKDSLITDGLIVENDGTYVFDGVSSPRPIKVTGVRNTITARNSPGLTIDAAPGNIVDFE